MGKSLEAAGLDADQIRLALRVAQVQGMWAQLVEDIILGHTNAVLLFTKDGIRQMHVYVDDSIFAAELNNRRELLVMRMKQLFNEEVDKLHIHISQGQRKSSYPFRDQLAKSKPVEPLAQGELDTVEQTCSIIEDQDLRAKFREAMISDLQRKKSENN